MIIGNDSNMTYLVSLADAFTHVIKVPFVYFSNNWNISRLRLLLFLLKELKGILREGRPEYLFTCCSHFTAAHAGGLNVDENIDRRTYYL